MYLYSMPMPDDLYWEHIRDLNSKADKPVRLITRPSTHVDFSMRSSVEEDGSVIVEFSLHETEPGENPHVYVKVVSRCYHPVAAACFKKQLLEPFVNVPGSVDDVISYYQHLREAVHAQPGDQRTRVDLLFEVNGEWIYEVD